MERMTGLSASQTVGHNALLLFPDLEKKGYAQIFARVFAGETVTLDEPIFVAQTGKTVQAQRHHSPLKNERGEIVGGIAILRDITETNNLIRQLKLLNDQLEVHVQQRTRELETAVKDLALEISKGQRTTDALKFIADSGLVLCSCLDYDKLIENSLELLTGYFASLCIIRVVREDQTIDHRFASARPSEEEMFREYEKNFSHDLGTFPNPNLAMKEGKPQWAPYITEGLIKEYAPDEARARALIQFKFKSYLIVPIAAQGKALGTISILSSTRHLDSDDMRVVQDLAGRFAMALINVQLIASLKSQITA
jgi:PAS domain S-box-containing protein